MNVEQRQAAVDPQTKPRDLGCDSACMQLSSTTTIATGVDPYGTGGDTSLPIFGPGGHNHECPPPNI